MKISVMLLIFSRGKYIGADEFSLSVYPSSQPVFMELVKNGRIADLMETGATIR